MQLESNFAQNLESLQIISSFFKKFHLWWSYFSLEIQISCIIWILLTLRVKQNILKSGTWVHKLPQMTLQSPDCFHAWGVCVYLFMFCLGALSWQSSSGVLNLVVLAALSPGRPCSPTEAWTGGWEEQWQGVEGQLLSPHGALPSTSWLYL